MRQRFEAMTEYILEIMTVRHRFTVTAVIKNSLKKAIKNMFAGNNDLEVYKDFFQWISKPDMFRLRRNHILEYANLAPLAYLHFTLEDQKVQNKIIEYFTSIKFYSKRKNKSRYFKANSLFLFPNNIICS